MATIFSFDLGSPYAWLAAERVDAVIAGEVIWEPVSLGAIFKATGRSSWALGDPQRRATGMAEIERRAHRRGLGPLVWPDPWPSHYLLAMRAATYAETVGQLRPFALAAFRLAFLEGRDLARAHHVAEAAERSGLDPAVVLAATANDSVKQALRARTEAALERGVFGVPSFAVGDELLWGDDRLDELAGAQEPAR
jgi:2-hydroxychromene-2-carboxylate isomerase